MARHWPHYFRKAGFTALWIFPILLAFLVVWKHSAPLPFWDEWNTPGAQLASWYRGTLTIAELCSQHNESRKLIPRLIYLPLFTVAGWNVQLALALVFGVLLACSYQRLKGGLWVQGGGPLAGMEFATLLWLCTIALSTLGSGVWYDKVRPLLKATFWAWLVRMNVAGLIVGLLVK